MFGKINCSKQQPLPSDHPYSSSSYLSNFAFGWTDGIVNAYDLVTSACSTVYETAEKITKTTINILGDCAVASLPVIKALGYAGIGEVVIHAFPDSYGLKVLTGIGAILYETDRASTIKPILESIPHATSGFLLALYAVHKFYQARNQWNYPLGYMELEEETRPIYYLTAKCPKATELYRRAPRFTLKSMEMGLSEMRTGWNRLEYSILVHGKEPTPNRFKKFLYALADAIHEPHAIKMFSDAEQGKLSSEEFFNRYNAIVQSSELMAVETAKKCVEEFGWLVKISSKERSYLEIDTKTNLKSIHQDEPGTKQRREVSEIWEKIGKQPYENRQSSLQGITCDTTDCTTKSVSDFVIQSTLEYRIETMNAQPSFASVPTLGRLIAFCPDAFKLWEESQAIGFTYNFEENSDEDPYNLFAHYLAKTLTAIVDHKEDKLEEQLRRGLLSQNKYIRQDLEIERQAHLRLYNITMKCREIFTQHTAKVFSIGIHPYHADLYDIEKFSKRRVVEKQSYYNDKWKTVDPKLYCEYHPSDLECTSHNGHTHSILKQKIHDLTIPKCSKKAKH